MSECRHGAEESELAEVKGGLWCHLCHETFVPEKELSTIRSETRRETLEEAAKALQFKSCMCPLDIRALSSPGPDKTEEILKAIAHSEKRLDAVLDKCEKTRTTSSSLFASPVKPEEEKLSERSFAGLAPVMIPGCWRQDLGEECECHPRATPPPPEGGSDKAGK